MEYQRFQQSIVARIDKGEEILENLKRICITENIQLANINAIGAVGKFTVGLFDTNKKKYFSNTYEGDFEIVSFTGMVTTMEEQYYQHIHMSVANKENKVYGGHLNSAFVSATCEMAIHIIEGKVDRYLNKEIGLNLLKFE